MDKFDYTVQLVPVKPDSMFLTEIQYDARAVRKIYAIHQLGTLGTRNILDTAACLDVSLSGVRSSSQDSGLLFPVGADFFKRRHIKPETETSTAFEHRLLSNHYGLHLYLATRTLPG